MAEELHGLERLAQKIRENKAQNPLDEMDVSIIRGLANHNMNVAKTARAVFMHPNTLRNHAKRIKQKTGCDPLDFFGLWKLLAFVSKTEGEKDGKT